MKATALTVYDNTTSAHFTSWAFGSGQWPTPTVYGFSSFIYNAGFIQQGNTSTFTPSGGERSNIIGDGQLVWQNITFNVTSTQSNASTATYGFGGLSGGALRAGMYIASIAGTTNDGTGFQITIPTQIVVIESVTYTTSTSGTFTTAFLGGTFSFQAETGTGQINATVTTFFLTGTQTLQANNASVGSIANAAYGNTATGQTTFKGYWLTGTSYVVGDVVIQVASGTGTSAVIGVWACILATSSTTPPTTNVANASWTQYPYELWETGDSALPAFVQENTQSQSVVFNPLPYNSLNVAGNTLVVFGRFTGGSGTPTISDTNGNTWINLFDVTNGSDINMVWVAYGAKSSTTTNYVTVAQPTQASVQMLIAEYSGVTSVSPQLDQSAEATGTSTAANSGNVTTLVANDLLLGFVSNSTTNGLTITPGASFTTRATVNGNTYLEDRVVTTTGTYNASATLSSSVPWFCAVVALKGTQLPAYYFKFEYGNQSTSVPSFAFQIGTAITTTGALNSSGLRGFREIITLDVTTASGASTFETDFYADATPGLAGGKFAMLGWRTATATSAQIYLGWERSKDNFGVDTGLYMTYLWSSALASSWKQSSVFATGSTNFGTRTTVNALSIFMGNNASLQVGNNIPVAPVFPSVGYFGNPITIFLGLAIQDTNEGVAFVTTVYGASHTYIMTKVASGASDFSSTNDSGLAMRWE